MFESYAASSGFDEYLHQPRDSGSSLGELMARLSAMGLEQLNQDHRGADSSSSVWAPPFASTTTTAKPVNGSCRLTHYRG